MIRISESCARAMMRVLEEIDDLDCRAKCSDKYFRQHFKTVVSVPPVTEAYAEIRQAIDDHEAAQQGGFFDTISSAGT